MISILSPVKKRPELLKRLIQSIYNTADNLDDIELILYIDDDDDSYTDILNSKHQINIIPVFGPKIILSDMWNVCWKNANGSIYHQANDDMIYVSEHWDTIVKEEFDKIDDKILLLYGRDGNHDEKLGTLSFLHENWVNTVGYFLPPYFKADYCDVWINDVAALIGRKHYNPQIYTEHLHWHVGKAPIDQTYADAQILRQQNNVYELYTSLYDKRVEDANKLLAFIAEHKGAI